jgi:hypothetical protein
MYRYIRIRDPGLFYTWIRDPDPGWSNGRVRIRDKPSRIRNTGLICDFSQFYYILQQCPDLNPYPIPNFFFRRHIQPKLTDSFGFGYTTLLKIDSKGQGCGSGFIWIRIQPFFSIRIQFECGSGFGSRFGVDSDPDLVWIRIRIDKKGWIRIWIRIHNPGRDPPYWLKVEYRISGGIQMSNKIWKKY